MKDAIRPYLLALAALAAMISLGYLMACGAVPRPDGGTGLLASGQSAPALSGKDQKGQERSVGDAKGKHLLVFFYPKDGTPGCTAQACALRDAWDQFSKRNVMIFGVSSDSAESHAEFAKKHALPFPLIDDSKGRWARAFGVNTVFGMTERVSFLIGPSGNVIKTFPDVDPAVHAKDVLAALDAK